MRPFPGWQVRHNGSLAFGSYDAVHAMHSSSSFATMASILGNRLRSLLKEIWFCSLLGDLHGHVLALVKKGMVLYSAVSSPLDRSKRFTLSSPGRPVHSDTVLGFSWKHSCLCKLAGITICDTRDTRFKIQETLFKVGYR